MYVKIWSRSVTTIEDLFTLGVSTSRGKAEKIGQFGSGTLMGVLTWIRSHGFPPVFLVNGKKVTFSVKPVKKSDGEIFRQVLLNGNPLSVALEYGELDWNNPEYAMREWICNAIDAGNDVNSCIVECDKIEAADDEVAVFIPVNETTLKYTMFLDKFFLHVRGLQDSETIPKKEIGPMRIYRKGIFVRELKDHSLFDYNLDFDINECRTGSSDSIEGTIRSHLRFGLNVDNVDVIFNALITGIDCFETKPIGSLSATWSTSLATKKVKLCMPMTTAEGAIPVHSDWYREICAIAGHLDGLRHMSVAEVNGYKAVTVSPEMRAKFNKICDLIELCELSRGKRRPQIECFTTELRNVNGMCDSDRGTISINTGNPNWGRTLSHELGHWYTGQADWHSEFIDFGYVLSSKLVDLI